MATVDDARKVEAKERAYETIGGMGLVKCEDFEKCESLGTYKVGKVGAFYAHTKPSVHFFFLVEFRSTSRNYE